MGEFDGIRVRANLMDLYETPVLHGHLADADALIAALGAAIRRRRADHPGVARSNVGGWHSATDMLDWGGAAAATLADTAVRMAKRLSFFDPASAWSARTASTSRWSAACRPVRATWSCFPPGCATASARTAERAIAYRSR